MICPKCGNNVDENMRFCGVCGTDVKAFEHQAQPQQNGYYEQNQQYNPNYSNQNYPNYNQYQTPPQKVDKPETLLNVLSFFFPIVGIILYFIERDSKPLRAKAALKWSLISIGVSVAFVILWMLLIPVFMFAVDSTMTYF